MNVIRRQVIKCNCAPTSSPIAANWPEQHVWYEQMCRINWG